MRCAICILGGLLVLLAAGGCDEGSMLDQALGTAEAAASTDTQLTGKLDPYVRCIDEQSPSVFEARRHYLSWIDDPAKGPTCKKRRYSVYKLRSVEACLSEMKQAHAAAPSLPALEQAGAGYAAALKQLAGLLEQAHTYYETDSYQRDECAAGQQLHGQLMKSWGEFTRADSRIRGIIEDHDEKLLASELQRTHKLHGRGLRLFHKRVQLEARRVVRVIRQQERTLGASLEPLSTAVAEFEATVDAMRRIARKKPEATKAAFFWDSFDAQTSEFLHAIKEFSARRKQGREYTAKEKKRLASGVARWVAGSFAKVKNEYEELTRISNSLEFRH